MVSRTLSLRFPELFRRRTLSREKLFGQTEERGEGWTVDGFRESPHPEPRTDAKCIFDPCPRKGYYWTGETSSFVIRLRPPAFSSLSSTSLPFPFLFLFVLYSFLYQKTPRIYLCALPQTGLRNRRPFVKIRYPIKGITGRCEFPRVPEPRSAEPFPDLCLPLFSIPAGTSGNY